MPSPPHNTVPPQADASILQWYRGFFDTVYIVLHPFLRVLDNAKISFSGEDWPKKDDIARYTEAVSWKEFQEHSKLPALSAIDIALRTSIGGLNKKYANHLYANRMEETCKQHNLIPPNEGAFAELLIDPMMGALKQLGHEWVWVGDEFGEVRELQYITHIADEPEKYLRHKSCVFTHQIEILYAVHWDSHFTFLCSDKSTIETILKKTSFEGFLCGENTEVYWSITDGGT